MSHDDDNDADADDDAAAAADDDDHHHPHHQHCHHHHQQHHHHHHHHHHDNFLFKNFSIETRICFIGVEIIACNNIIKINANTFTLYFLDKRIFSLYLSTEIKWNIHSESWHNQTSIYLDILDI